MSAYLDEQTPHLRSLHTQLALPSDALETDLARIEAAIRGVITSIIRERESQVDELKDDISRVKRDVASLGRAVGEKGRGVVAVSRRESFEDETLPRQLERLNEQAQELKTVYDERLQHIQGQQATLERLATLLGHPFLPPKPLQPIASSSKQSAPQSSDNRKRASSQTIAQAIAHGVAPTTWYDVGESVTEELDEAVMKALDERDNRRRNLCQTLFNLIWLHNELALPPVPTSHPHHFPPSLLPPYSEEETPGSYASYERLLSRLIASNPLPPGDSEDWPEVDDLEGMEGVEPQVPLVEWAEEVTELWNVVKEEHEARIQELYNLVEPLWTRLEVEQETTDLFVDMNRGSGEATIKAYEAEYERLLEIRRASLSSFIVNTRKEVDALQTELMMSDDERAEFGAFIDDDYSEELLHLHELEIERLRDEVESKAGLLPKVREWHALVNDEEELERNALDPNRFSRRGGAMLREEKLRKRVMILKPKIEMELLSLLPTWEEEHGRPFMVSGERVVTKIHDAIEAKELAKEAKKRAKQGLGPAAPARQLAPAKTVRATPSQASRSTTNSTSTRLGKRTAPAPTPSAHPTKRPKAVVTGTGTGTAGMHTGGSSAFGGSSLRPTGVMMGKTAGRSVSAARVGAGASTGSPTPFHGMGRAMSHSSATMFSSGAGGSKIPASAMSSTKTIKAVGVGALGVSGDGRRPRRESFRPRQSVAPGMGGGGALGGWREEDEDVF
ncbi:hypothetical protein IAT38_000898 [Cryptococcus sp. DSM 104549]